MPPSLEEKIAAAGKTRKEAEEACKLLKQCNKDSVGKDGALFGKVIKATLKLGKLLVEQAKAVVVADDGDEESTTLSATRSPK